MKKIITLTLILTTIAFSSCKKKTTAPESTTTTSTPVNNNAIKVQYRVTAASGQMNVEYTSVEDGVITTTKTQLNRITFSYSFEWTTKQKLSISASNTTPSGKEVTVEIYVDGVLFKSGEANSPGAVASAEGIYNN